MVECHLNRIGARAVARELILNIPSERDSSVALFTQGVRDVLPKARQQNVCAR